MSRRILRWIVTSAGGVEPARLPYRYQAQMIDAWLFAWRLSEDGDPIHFERFRDCWTGLPPIKTARGKLRTLTTDPSQIRRAVDEQGLPLDQDGRFERLPSVDLPTAFGLVTIQPGDRAEQYLIRKYLAAVTRWRESDDAAELLPFRTWTVRDRRTWRTYRLLTIPDALTELIARGLLPALTERQESEENDRCRA